MDIICFKLYLVIILLMSKLCAFVTLPGVLMLFSLFLGRSVQHVHNKKIQLIGTKHLQFYLNDTLSIVVKKQVSFARHLVSFN